MVYFESEASRPQKGKKVSRDIIIDNSGLKTGFTLTTKHLYFAQSQNIVVLDYFDCAADCIFTLNFVSNFACFVLNLSAKRVPNIHLVGTGKSVTGKVYLDGKLTRYQEGIQGFHSIVLQL